jgi:hypothetical protein
MLYYYYTLNKVTILDYKLDIWRTNNLLLVLDGMDQLENIFSNTINNLNKKKNNTEGEDLIKISYCNKIIPNQPEEEYYGNREYKLYLDIHNNNDKLQKRSTQLLYRLNEGEGRAIYLIGVNDNGISIGCNLQDLFISIKSIIRMSNIVKSEITKITIYHSENGNYIGTVRCKKEIII